MGASLEEDLGSEDFEVREKARGELWSEGEKNRNLLENLSLSNDPEVAWQARGILKLVNLGLFPDTPPEIFSAVERYLEAGAAAEREEIFEKLVEFDAIPQLVRIYELLPEGHKRTTLESRLDSYLESRVQQAFLEGDEEAWKLVEQGRVTPKGHLRWLDLMRIDGRLAEIDAQLTDGDRIELAYLQGDIDYLSAHLPEDDFFKSSIFLLQGNMEKFLEERALLHTDNPIAKKLVEISNAYWVKDSVRPTLPKSALKKLVESCEEDSWSRHQEALFLAGYRGHVAEVLPYFAEVTPNILFGVLTEEERFEEAFSVYGFDPKVPISDDILREWKEELNPNLDERNDTWYLLFRFITFYSKQGDSEQAERLMRVLFEEYKEDKKGLIRILAELAAGSRGFSSSGTELAIELAREAEIDPDEFLRGCCGREGVRYVEKFFLDEFPGLTDWERVRNILSLYGFPAGIPFEDVRKNAAAYADVTYKEPSYRKVVELLFIVEFLALEKETTEAYRYFAENTKSLGGAGGRDLQMNFSAGRYHEVLKAFDEFPEGTATQGDLLKKYIALRKTGQAKKAEEVYAIVECTGLGNYEWLIELARLWAIEGSWEEAHSCYRRAFILSGSSYNLLGYHDSGDLMVSVADSAYKSQQWDEAGMFSEAVLFVGSANLDLDDTFEVSSFYFRSRVIACQAMSCLAEGRKGDAHALLEELADHYVFTSEWADWMFYFMRLNGYHEEVELVWSKWSKIAHYAANLYPNGANTQNTIAWMASRAGCDLEDALVWTERAVELEPRSAAYLDTKAEVLFALERREEALAVSGESIKLCLDSDTLATMFVQYRHFENDPFPLTGTDNGKE